MQRGKNEYTNRPQQALQQPRMSAHSWSDGHVARHLKTC